MFFGRNRQSSIHIVIKYDTRDRLKLLKSVCDGAKSILILMFANPDPDALASALALKKILDSEKRTVSIGYTGAVGRPENAAMIKRLEIPAFPVSEKEIERAGIIALVDAQPQFFAEAARPRCDIVIDHHPLTDKLSVRFADIRPNYLSASSIMTEYVRAAGVRLTKNLASALFYGIKTDTRHFMGDLSNGDIEAIKWLSKKADRYIVEQIEFSQFSQEGLDYFSIALVRKLFVNGVMWSARRSTSCWSSIFACPSTTRCRLSGFRGFRSDGWRRLR